MATLPTTTYTSRNSFGAIINAPAWALELIQAAERAGAWTTGIESDRRHHGTSINVDLYSYDEARGLVVVQVRQCQFRPDRYNKVRKDYYLVGRNENGTAFAHPVDSVARSRRTFGSAEAGVLIALARLWACDEEDLDEIVRNGDVAFVPERRLPAGAELVGENAVTIRESHHVRALAGGQVYRAKDTYYVTGRAKIEHTKGQHPTARVRDGVWRVQAGIRASSWGFTTPTSD